VVEEARITSFVPPEEAARLFRRAGLEPVREGRFARLDSVSTISTISKQEDPIR